tara:strand:+ start:195 stop:1082 length:888 start_codon:yes stop_codon:yes gene_type:complete
MTTAATVIDKTLRQLLSGTVEARNRLTTTLNSSATSVVVDYSVEGLRAGQVCEIDSELMYIWVSDSATRTLTVQRGFNGTTAAAHTSGTIVTINPRFPRAQVLEEINNEMTDLSSPSNGLFKVQTLNITYNGSDKMVNLTGATSVIDILNVSVRYLTDDYPIARKVKIVRDLPTDDFASGFALRFDQAVMPGRLRVVYKAPYTTAPTEATDINTTCGIQDSITDIVTIGAQIRLMAPREIKRNFVESQGDTRRAEEVVSGAITNSVSNLKALRKDRIIAEAARLARAYPTFLTRE